MNVAGTCAALVVAATVLAGCGSGSSGDSGAEQADTSTQESSAEASFDPSTAELPAGPFCDQVDVAVVAKAVGLPPGTLKLERQTKVGEEITPGPGLPPMPAQTNSCEYGKESGFVVGIDPTYTPEEARARLQEAREQAEQKPPKNAVFYTDCAVEETSDLGTDGYLQTCETVGSSKGQTTAIINGVVGGGRVACYLQVVGKTTTSELGDSVSQACLSIVEGLGTS